MCLPEDSIARADQKAGRQIELSLSTIEQSIELRGDVEGFRSSVRKLEIARLRLEEDRLLLIDAITP